MANTLPDSAGLGNQIPKVNSTGTAYETVQPVQSMLGLRATDNGYPDPDFYHQAAYSGATFTLSAASDGGPGAQQLSIGSGSSNDQTVTGPAFPVTHDIPKWYGMQMGCSGTGTVAEARLEVEFFSNIAGTISLGKRFIARTSSASPAARKQLFGAAFRAPSTARSARFVMTRMGNAGTTTGASFSSPEVRDQRSVSGDLTYRIGTSTADPAHYPSLQEAVDALHPAVKVKPGTRIVLLIEDGYLLPGGLAVAYGDYGMFEIKSEANKLVKLASNWVGVSVAPFNGQGIGAEASDGKGRDSNCLIVGHHARMPILGCLIDMEGKGDDGYKGYTSCIGHVRYGCGVINAGHDGCNMHSSLVHGDQSIWNGAGNHGIRLAFGSTGTFQEARAAFCCQDPDGAESSAIDVSRTSTLHARLINAKFAGRVDSTPVEYRAGGPSHTPANYTASGIKTTTYNGQLTNAVNVTCVAINLRRTSHGTIEEGNFSGSAGIPGKVGGVNILTQSTASAFSMIVNDNLNGVPLSVSRGAQIHIDGAQFVNYAGNIAVEADRGCVISGAGVVGKAGPGTSQNPLRILQSETNLLFNSPGPDGIWFNEDWSSLSATGSYQDNGSAKGTRSALGRFQASTDATSKQTTVNGVNPVNGWSIDTWTGGAQFVFDTNNDIRIYVLPRAPLTSDGGGVGTMVIRSDTGDVYRRKSAGWAVIP